MNFFEKLKEKRAEAVARREGREADEARSTKANAERTKSFGALFKRKAADRQAEEPARPAKPVRRREPEPQPEYEREEPAGQSAVSSAGSAVLSSGASALSLGSSTLRGSDSLSLAGGGALPQTDSYRDEAPGIELDDDPFDDIVRESEQNRRQEPVRQPVRQTYRAPEPYREPYREPDPEPEPEPEPAPPPPQPEKPKFKPRLFGRGAKKDEEEAPRAKAKKQPAKKEAASGREKVYRQAFDWETTQVELYQKSEAKAWRCAKLVSVVCVMLAAAIVFMMPLKQTLPFVIKVDQSTGMAEIVDIADRQNIPVSETMDKFWLSEYVRSYENYDWRTVENDYIKIREMSMPNVFEQYARMHGDDPGTLESQYLDNKVIRIEFVSIIPAGNGIATVRFVKKTLTTRGFTEEGREHLQATIGYEYDPTYIVSERRRLVNPFGFKVTSYRVDQEMR